jgi:AcrR family transcriptional regulator
MNSASTGAAWYGQMREKVDCARRARREAILDIAREVFSREGYAAASMSHIASRLGGSKGTLYNYFASKEELFRAHVQERCGCHAREMFATPLAGDDPAVVLAEVAERVLTFILSDEATAFYSLVVAEAQRTPEIGQAFFESGLQTGLRRITDYLERSRADGKINTDNCGEAAEDFVSLIQSGLYRKRVLNTIPMPSNDEIRATAQRAAATFMRAYGVAGWSSSDRCGPE